MADSTDIPNSDRLLFRLQHIIPRNLSSAFFANRPLASSNATNSFAEPEEFTFPMTWGNVAGT